MVKSFGNYNVIKNNNYDTFYSYLYENGFLKITNDHELFACDICDKIFQEKYYSVLNKCKDVDICYICGDSNKYIDYNI